MDSRNAVAREPRRTISTMLEEDIHRKPIEIPKAPDIEKKREYTSPIEIDTLIVGLYGLGHTFLHAEFGAKIEENSVFFIHETDSKPVTNATHWTNKNIGVYFTIPDRPGQGFLSFGFSIEEKAANIIADTILKEIKPKKIIILDDLESYAYLVSTSLKKVPDEPALFYIVNSSIKRDEHLLLNNLIPYHTSPPAIIGLGAALITHAEFYDIPCILFISILGDGILSSHSLSAFIPVIDIELNNKEKEKETSSKGPGKEDLFKMGKERQQAYSSVVRASVFGKGSSLFV